MGKKIHKDMHRKPKIRLYLLGGTITMQSSPDAGQGVVPTIDATGLCREVSGLDQVADVEARTDMMLASSNLTYQHAIKLAQDIEKAAQSNDVDGFVIVQGTDTLEEMAFLLDCMLDIKKPIVVTGAMRSPAQISPDGQANLMSAVICASTKSVGLAGVVVVLNDNIHSAAYVGKYHTSDVASFQSPNCGPIGRVVESTARLFAVPVKGMRIRLPKLTELKNVTLVKASYGDEGTLLKLITAPEFNGLVIEAMGAGHLPESYLEILDKLLKDMPIILSSRIGRGHVLRQTYGYKGAEIDLINRGLIPSGILDGLKAKILLTLCLIKGLERDEIEAVFTSWDL